MTIRSKTFACLVLGSALGCTNEDPGHEAIASLGQAVTGTITISGRVTGPGGGNLIGAAVQLSGASQLSAVSDTSGNYSIPLTANLPVSVSVAATLSGCTFSGPVNLNSVSTNQTLNFNGTVPTARALRFRLAPRAPQAPPERRERPDRKAFKARSDLRASQARWVQSDQPGRLELSVQWARRDPKACRVLPAPGARP